MLPYLGRRLLQILIVIWGILTVIFVLVRLSGDPVTHFITQDTPAEQIALIRKLLGLDDPLYVQYTRFLSRAVVGDFGESFRFRQPAMPLVLRRLPASLELTGVAIAFSLLVAIPLGTLSAMRKGSLLDTSGMGLALLGQAMPIFWVGTMLILIFAVRFRLFPTSGYGTLAHLVLPGLTLSAYLLARTSRLVRSGLLEVLGQDYIRTARAKGLREAVVVGRHALRNVAITIVTVAGLDVIETVGGSIVVEILFAWPGVGRLLLLATFNRDPPLIQAAAFVMALVAAGVSLAVDVSYAALNPRIRYD